MKKGFTLAELLMVIVILAIISIITFPIVLNLIDSSKIRAYNEQVRQIKDAANKWALDNTNMISPSSDTYLSLDTLIESGNIGKDVIINPITKEKMRGCVKIYYDSVYEKYQYDFDQFSMCEEI